MADDSDFQVNATPSLQQLIEFFADTVFDVTKLGRLEVLIANAIQKGNTVSKGAEHQAAPFVAELFGKFLSATESTVEPIVGPFLAKLAGHLIGVDVSPDELRRSAASGGETAIGEAVAAIAFRALGSGEGEAAPGDENARKFIAMMAQLVFNGWFEETAFEIIATLFPDMDSFESVAELPKNLVDSLGLGRLARVALRPLAQIAIATPLEWKLHKERRPTLLGPSTVARQWARGRWDWPDVVEELARAGYSDERINAIVNEQRKFISVAEVALLARHIETTTFDAKEYLGEAGYETSDAERALLAHETARLETEQDALASIAVAAYARRDIDEQRFIAIIDALSMPIADQDKHAHRGQLQRDLNIKFLSPAEAEACYLADVVPIAVYREALTRAGYEPDAALALELLLETKKNKSFSVAELRKSKQDAADAAAAQKAADLAARKAALDEQRRLKAEGPLTAWEHAVVTGLVPLARYAALLAERYDGETVATFTAQAEQARVAYLAQQQRAVDATKRAAQHALNVGQLAQAVYEGVLSVDQFRTMLTQQQLAPADADLLAATVAARLKDLTTAKQLRADAAAKAGKKRIDLTRAELLVRRGHATLAQYRDLLGSLGYDDVSIGAMVDLLQLKIADDAAAQQARAAVAAKKDTVSISFADLRRAVVLGVATVDEFSRFLGDHKFTVDAQRILLAELRDDVASADAARAARKAAQLRRGDSQLSLSALARAARLGLVSIAAGYTADDVAIDTDLLTQEIAQTRLADARAAAALAKQADHGLPLTQLAKAVKLEEATLDDYRGRAMGLGYSDDDAQTLVNVLADELAAAKDARARHRAIAADLKTRNLSLGELDAAVVAGALTIDGYRAKLSDLGYAADDVDLLVSLLELKRSG